MRFWKLSYSASVIQGNKVASTFHPGEVDRLDRRTISKRAVFAGAAVFLIYYLLSSEMFGQLIPSTSGVIGEGADPFLAGWFVAWIAHSIVHFSNPLYSQAMNYPRGVNLAQNAEAPLIGLVLSPVLSVLGVARTLNLAFILSPVLDAMALFLVLRRLSFGRSAAFMGGLLYGFGPFTVAQSTGHLNLIVNPLVPIICLLGGLLVFSSVKRVRRSVMLGVIIGLGVYISPEITADNLIVIAPCIITSWVVLGLRRSISAMGWLRSALSFMGSGFVAGVILIPYLWMFLAGPGRYIGSPQPIGNQYAASLKSLVVPSSITRFSLVGGHLAATAVPGNLSEDGAFIGVGLVIAAVTLGAFCLPRMSRMLRIIFAWALGMGLVALVLELGRSVRLGGQSSVSLPFKFLGGLPVLGSLLPLRFGLFVDLSLAVLIGSVIETCVVNLRADSSRRPLGFVVVISLCVMSAVTWWPDFPRPFQSLSLSHSEISSLNAHIPPNSNVLTYPLPSPNDGEPLLWQADASFSYHIVGNYSAIRGPQGGPISTTYPLNPLGVEAFLTTAFDGSSFWGAGVPPQPALVDEIRQFVREYSVTAIVVEEVGNSGGRVGAVMERALGPASWHLGSLRLWLRK